MTVRSRFRSDGRVTTGRALAAAAPRAVLAARAGHHLAVSDADRERAFGSNATAAFHPARTCAPRLSKHGGTTANVSSVSPFPIPSGLA